MGLPDRRPQLPLLQVSPSSWAFLAEFLARHGVEVLNVIDLPVGIAGSEVACLERLQHGQLRETVAMPPMQRYPKPR